MLSSVIKLLRTTISSCHRQILQAKLYKLFGSVLLDSGIFELEFRDGVELSSPYNAVLAGFVFIIPSLRNITRN